MKVAKYLQQETRPRLLTIISTEDFDGVFFLVAILFFCSILSNFFMP